MSTPTRRTTCKIICECLPSTGMSTGVDNPELAFNASVGQVISTLMKVQGRQVNDLAALFHWHRNNAADKLAGRTRFSPYELSRVADWLGTTPGVFYGPVDALFQPGILTVPVVRTEAKPLHGVTSAPKRSAKRRDTVYSFRVSAKYAA